MRKGRRSLLSRRCGARCKQRLSNPAAVARARMEGTLDRLVRSSGYCRNWAVRGKARCRFHGGMSTGPRTAEGKARVVAAMLEGRRRWLAGLKAEGKPAPCGRRKGGRNAPLEEREHAAYVHRCRREFREVELVIRAQRQARRAKRLHDRLKAADHARRAARMVAGFPYWTDEEWENL